MWICSESKGEVLGMFCLERGRNWRTHWFVMGRPRRRWGYCSFRGYAEEVCRCGGSRCSRDFEVVVAVVEVEGKKSFRGSGEREVKDISYEKASRPFLSG